MAAVGTTTITQHFSSFAIVTKFVSRIFLHLFCCLCFPCHLYLCPFVELCHCHPLKYQGVLLSYFDSMDIPPFAFIQGKLAFVKEALSHLPTKIEQEIRDHESWYREYLELNDRKKEVIQKWRERKEASRTDFKCKTLTFLEVSRQTILTT